ncbi:MAG: HAD family hydrolase [Candidatus Micrarchaeaceae archaeon]
MRSRKLLLFDIDGTLLTMWRVHEKAYEATINELYGVPGVNFRDSYTPGDSNEEIVRSNLSSLGYKRDFIELHIGEVAKALLRYYSMFIAPENIRILPGVNALLGRLKGKNGVSLGVVTGNREDTANMILRSAGLSSYFSFVVGAGRDGDREQRLRLAVNEAAKPVPASAITDVFYFDDSYASIPISRKLGIISMAVATGETSYVRLADAKPDHLFKDLGDTARIMDIIEIREALP